MSRYVYGAAALVTFVVGWLLLATIPAVDSGRQLAAGAICLVVSVACLALATPADVEAEE